MNERGETGNWILDALPDEELLSLAPGMERYELKNLEVLFVPDEPSPWAYFPSSGVVSFLRGFSDGSQIEVGIVGREGMAGLHGFLGTGLEPMRAVVQCRGVAHRVDRDLLAAQFREVGVLHRLLLQFTYALLTQISLTAACNQLHTVDQRLARWLLAMSDRALRAELDLSHEFLAHMLGTARGRITEALGRFRSRGGVGNGRGRIIIEDRKVLEAAACECYDELRDSYAGGLEEPSR